MVFKLRLNVGRGLSIGPKDKSFSKILANSTNFSKLLIKSFTSFLLSDRFTRLTGEVECEEV